MKICRIVLCVLICLSLLVACNQPTDKEVYYKIQKKLGELESYECIARVNVINDDEEITEYTYKQIFKKPDSYRLEILSPDSVKGNLMVSNGKIAWVYSPSINHTYRIDSTQKQQNELLFIGYFMKNYITSKESEINSETNNKRQLIVISTDIPGGNQHFSKQKLWFDRKSLLPTQLQILDGQNKPVFNVYYEDFNYNPKLEDNIFHLNTQSQ